MDHASSKVDDRGLPCSKLALTARGWNEHSLRPRDAFCHIPRRSFIATSSSSSGLLMKGLTPPEL
jgi:hypothetical protein